MVALQEQLQSIGEHKMDTLLEAMELEGKQSEYFRETLNDEGTEDSMEIKSMEPEEGFEAEEAEDQEAHKENLSHEARIRNLEGMVAQLQEIAGKLEEKLKLVGD